MNLENYEMLRKGDELSLRMIENFSASATSKLFEQEIREAVSSELLCVLSEGYLKLIRILITSEL